MGRIFFRTTAYNAEKTLARCMDSVLNQTCRNADIVYYICDNGSTDHTGDIIREYAARDPRVRPFFNRKNREWEPATAEYQEFMRSLADDDCLCTLDADDEYALSFLENLLPFMEEHRLDIAACGTKLLNVQTGKELGERCMPAELLITGNEDFSRYFPMFHQFMRPLWGKIYMGSVAKHMATNATMPPKWKTLTYGGDTLCVFSILRHATRIGIYPQKLHNYYISPKSVSYQYTPKRFDSDVYLYNDAVDYLSTLGPVSEANRLFLACVYANAVSDTVDVIGKAGLSPEEKLAEMRRIAVHPITRWVYSQEDDDIRRSRQNLRNAVVFCGLQLRGDSEDFTVALRLLAPDCGTAVTRRTLPLLAQDERLFFALRDDDSEALLSRLLEMAGTRRYRKYKLRDVVRALAEDRPLLWGIDDEQFLRHYRDIYLLVWRRRNIEALDAMTGLLLEGKGMEETFLRLYLSLAALEEQVPAFLFGKLRTAQFYLRRGREEECRSVLGELEEVGMEDNAELEGLRRRLQEKSKPPA